MARACRRVGRLVVLARKRGVCVSILFCVPKQRAFEVFEVNIAFAWYTSSWVFFWSPGNVWTGQGASRAGVKLACWRFGVSFGSYVRNDESSFFTFQLFSANDWYP